MLSELSNAEVLTRYAALRKSERRVSAGLLAYIGEIDARHLYLGQGFESMRDFCMATLELSEHAALQRVQVARLARTFPGLLPAIAEGRLHIATVRVLSAHLTAANADELIQSASGNSVTQVEILIARRFPQPEPLRLDEGIVASQKPATDEIPLALRRVDFYKTPRARTKIAPIAPERFTLQVSIAGAVYDKLLRAQELLGHALPSGDVERVIERALESLIERLEKRKFGSADGQRKAQTGGARRAIPSQIRARVYKRDGGRCAHLYEDGRRCESTARLEFDHIVPLARGGRTTVENLRLLCRAHNQAEAERVFGRDFIEGKRCKDGS